MRESGKPVPTLEFNKKKQKIIVFLNRIKLQRRMDILLFFLLHSMATKPISEHNNNFNVHEK